TPASTSHSQASFHPWASTAGRSPCARGACSASTFPLITCGSSMVSVQMQEASAGRAHTLAAALAQLERGVSLASHPSDHAIRHPVAAGVLLEGAQNVREHIALPAGFGPLRVGR